jgi:hypothetical protein
MPAINFTTIHMNSQSNKHPNQPPTLAGVEVLVRLQGHNAEKDKFWLELSMELAA